MNADLPTLQPAGLQSGFAVGDEEHSTPQLSLGGTSLAVRFQSLAIILERLWIFHEAMRSGKPLEQSDELLAEVGSALTRAKGR